MKIYCRASRNFTMKKGLFLSQYSRGVIIAFIFLSITSHVNTIADENVNENYNKLWYEKVQGKYQNSEFLHDILNKEIRAGMTNEMIIDIFGNPDDIVEVIYPECGCPMENWIYGESTKEYQYITFENNRVLLWGSKDLE
jgi:hypothetical protein